MDTSRLIRYTIPGWVFIFTIILQFWIFGGTFPSLDFTPSNATTLGAVVAFLVAFASSAAIGLFVSTIATMLAYLWLGPQLDFRLPRNANERSLYQAGLREKIGQEEFRAELSTLLGLPDDPQRKAHFRHPKKTRRLIHVVYSYFQMSYRLTMPTAVMEYSTRRWNGFWTHVNSIAAILLGTIIGVWTRLLWVPGFWSGPKEPDLFKWFVELLLMVYVLCGWLLMCRARREAMDIDFKCTIELNLKRLLPQGPQTP